MKKYLNTPEEVINALKEGKEIESEEGCRYKMIDGVICFFAKTTGWLVGTHIDNEEKPYIEEAEPLKFEVGKFYKNRSGKKVLFCFDRERGTYPLHFISQEDGQSIFLTKKGTTFYSEETNDLDIIGEWED